MEPFSKKVAVGASIVLSAIPLSEGIRKIEEPCPVRLFCTAERATYLPDEPAPQEPAPLGVRAMVVTTSTATMSSLSSSLLWGGSSS